MASIRIEAPDALAGLWFEHKPDLRVHLRLTGEPSPALKTIIDTSPLPIIVSTDAAVSLAESRRRLKEASPSLAEVVPELQGIGTDERTGEVVMDVFVGGSPEEVAATTSRAEEAAASLNRETGLPVRIVYLAAPAGPCHSPLPFAR